MSVSCNSTNPLVCPQTCIEAIEYCDLSKLYPALILGSLFAFMLLIIAWAIITDK